MPQSVAMQLEYNQIFSALDWTMHNLQWIHALIKCLLIVFLNISMIQFPALI